MENKFIAMGKESDMFVPGLMGLRWVELLVWLLWKMRRV
jgi:hypothetical protein